ncbi:MAG: hypothetical protein HOH65_13050 [Rhodospirillaceae bacterium]|nr:hypothetical protein [Rhodospirillaceae bacterium]
MKAAKLVAHRSRGAARCCRIRKSIGTYFLRLGIATVFTIVIQLSLVPLAASSEVLEGPIGDAKKWSRQTEKLSSNINFPVILQKFVQNNIPELNNTKFNSFMSRLSGFYLRAGPISSSTIIYEEAYANRIYSFFLLAFFDNNPKPLLWKITLVRPKQDWRVYGVAATTDIDKSFPGLSARPLRQDWK